MGSNVKGKESGRRRRRGGVLTRGGFKVHRWPLVLLLSAGVFLPVLAAVPVEGSHLPANYLEKGVGSDADAVIKEKDVVTIFSDASLSSEAEGHFIKFNSSEEEEGITTTISDAGEDEFIISSSTSSRSTSTSTPLPSTTSSSSSSSTESVTSSSPNAASVTQSTTVKSTASSRNEILPDEQSTDNSVVAVGTANYLVALNGKRYKEISANCDSSKITITSEFLSPFKGRIYAYGYPDEVECGSNNIIPPSENVTFSLPLGQCGVQMMAVDPEFDSPKRHELTLYIQYSSVLQQVIDDKVSVSCVEIQRTPMEESMQILDFSDPSSFPSFRQGRRMGSVKDPKAKGQPAQSQQTRISSKIGESWMEILHGKDPSSKSRKMLPVAVGQDVTLVISTKVMRGYDARIVNCSANDGSRLGTIDGYRSQQILDSAGCSVDTVLVPNFRRRRLPIESRNRMITLHFATFPAFKFPERDHLHVKCQVAYCQGPCPQETCDSGLTHFGTWRDKYGRIADALIDTTEIVNSIEVFAPELEDVQGDGHHFERHQSSIIPHSGGGSATDVSLSHSQGRQMRFSSIDPKSSMDSDGSNSNPPHFLSVGGGSSVCVSPGTIIMALVILGVVLVISATATLWFALKRSEARKYQQAVKHAPFQHAGPQPYYRFSHW